MKVLVTGSAGLVGSATVELFKEKGCEVIGVDNDTRSTLFDTDKKAIDNNVDITDKIMVNALFLEHRFDAIIHTAAQPSHDFSRYNVLLDFDINARGTVLLLEATRKYCPEAVFIHVSTDKVYGTNMQPYATEELKTRYNSDFPFNEYLELDYAMHSPFGCSKTAADLYAQEYGLYFGLKTTIFRPGCITGRNHEGAELHGFLAYLAKCIKEETPYKIFGYKGKQVRDQIHANDLANAFWYVVQNPKVAAVYNIGGGKDRSVSILEAIKMIEKETNKKAIIEYIEEPRKGDRIWDVHDVSKFREDYPDWNCKYSLKDIIRDLCQK